MYAAIPINASRGTYYEAHFVCFLFLSFLNFNPVSATEVKYTYDVLGRLTFVDDPVNGNRDFTFDPAGNRRGVLVGANVKEGDSDPSAKPLVAPTGLSTYGPISRGGGYPSTWNVVEYAEYYIFRTVDNKEYTVYSTSITEETEARWVRACNDNYGCGPKAYF